MIPLQNAIVLTLNTAAQDISTINFVPMVTGLGKYHQKYAYPVHRVIIVALNKCIQSTAHFIVFHVQKLVRSVQMERIQALVKHGNVTLVQLVIFVINIQFFPFRASQVKSQWKKVNLCVTHAQLVICVQIQM